MSTPNAIDRYGRICRPRFLRPDGLLIGYVESADLAAAQRAMDATEVNSRWQTQMAGFFLQTEGRPPDQAFELLTEVFHLDETEPGRAATTRTHENE